MQITVVAVMCRVFGAVVAEGVGTLPEAVCREVIVIKQDMPMQACMLSQPALAEWKASSIYKSDDWRVARIKCVPGGRLRTQGTSVKRSEEHHFAGSDGTAWLMTA